MFERGSNKFYLYSYFMIWYLYICMIVYMLSERRNIRLYLVRWPFVELKQFRHHLLWKCRVSLKWQNYQFDFFDLLQKLLILLLTCPTVQTREILKMKNVDLVHFADGPEKAGEASRGKTTTRPSTESDWMSQPQKSIQVNYISPLISIFAK